MDVGYKSSLRSLDAEPESADPGRVVLAAILVSLLIDVTKYLASQ